MPEKSGAAPVLREISRENGTRAILNQLPKMPETIAF
jgi:hypothetical protein